MKTKLFILLFSCFLLACKTQKETSIKTDLKIENNTKADIAVDSTNVRKETSTHVETGTKSESVTSEFEGKRTIETTEIEYDTDKPVNPVTGEHPKKRETKTKTTEEGAKKETSSAGGSHSVISQTTQSDSTNTHLTDNSDYDTKITEKSEEKMSFKFDRATLFDIITVVVIFAAVVGAWFVYEKYIN
jgi:hypothetical protein